MVHCWIGLLKFIPVVNPPEGLAWQTSAGLLVISDLFRQISIPLAMLHKVSAFTPNPLPSVSDISRPSFCLARVGQ